MASVTIDDVHKTFAGTAVIRGIDLTLADGECVALIGPSGCGKSTLLRMIAGLEPLSAGAIRIDGRRIDTLAPKHRDIAMVFQADALYPHMSVATTLGFPLRLRGVPGDTIARKVGAVAASLGLAPLLERLPSQLSGGQRRRVAIGRAIIRDPAVFLFDEPLSHLDAALRAAMRAELRALQRRLRTTTLSVTHDQVEAMTLADRVGVMSEGRIAQIGAPLELYDRPANIVVAQTLGSPAMNLVAGTVSDMAFSTPGGLCLPLARGRAGETGRPVLCGLRPEHFALADDGIPARVSHAEFTGTHTQLTADIGGAIVTALLPQRLGPPPATLRLAIAPHHLHLFDPQTGRRLD